MGGNLQRLRELAARFREGRLAVSHASPLTALFDHRRVRAVLFFAAIGAFLSSVGAFGVGDLPYLQRTLYFCGAMVCSALLGCALNALAKRVAWIRARGWARFGAVALPAAPVMGWAVWASEHWLAPASQQVSDLPMYVLVACGMSVVMTLLAFIAFPERRIVTKAATRGSLLSARLPVRLRSAEIWALQAEDHYLRVHTSLGSDLILMRLSDAIAELDGLDGAQTHRSWWVAKTAVASARRIDERAVIMLPNGVEAPVSRKFAPALRRAGWF